MSPLRSLFLRASRSRWLARQLAHRRFVRRAVRRFLPGEGLEEALSAAEELRRSEVASVLTCLGENVAQAAEAAAVAAHYDDVLRAIRRRALGAHVSVKLTHLGLDVDPAATRDSLTGLADAARTLGSFVWIDMEGSAYTDATLETYRHVLREGGPVGVCLQAYLHRTPRDLDSLLPLAPAVRLVKGAYREPARIAYRRRGEVDRAYLRLADTLLTATRDGARPVFGTHDPAMIEGVRQRASRLGLPERAFEIQMLYGIRREAQLRLAREGCAVRVLISYGQGWFPWYMRRLAERPANVWFAVRALLGG